MAGHIWNLDKTIKVRKSHISTLKIVEKPYHDHKPDYLIIAKVRGDEVEIEKKDSLEEAKKFINEIAK